MQRCNSPSASVSTVFAVCFTEDSGGIVLSDFSANEASTGWISCQNWSLPCVCVVVNRRAHSLGISLGENSRCCLLCLFFLFLSCIWRMRRLAHVIWITRAEMPFWLKNLHKKGKKNATLQTEQLIFLPSQTAARVKVAQTSGGKGGWNWRATSSWFVCSNADS